MERKNQCSAIMNVTTAGRWTALFSLLAVCLALLSTVHYAQAVHNAAFDLDDTPETRIQLSPTLSFGAKADIELEGEKNFDLETDDADNLGVLEPSLSISLLYVPRAGFSFLLNTELSQKIVDDQANKKDDAVHLELNQAYIMFNELYGIFDLKIGRQQLEDKRQWIFDEELDAIRVCFMIADVAFDLSVSEKNDKDLLHGKEDDDMTNYVLFLRYLLLDDFLISPYIVIRDNRIDGSESPVFYGLEALGSVSDTIEYWLELAHVRGRNGTQKIRGFGIDIGGTYEFDYKIKPSITVLYAFGTGDGDETDDRDLNFRQTGLQDNEDKFNGIARLKYYGSVFDPELSNLEIVTGAFGIRPTADTSVDMLYHYYKQDKAFDEIRDAEVDKDPDGTNRELGHGVDLVLAYRNKKGMKTSLEAGYFFAGQAFPDAADNAVYIKTEIQYEF